MRTAPKRVPKGYVGGGRFASKTATALLAQAKSPHTSNELRLTPVSGRVFNYKEVRLPAKFTRSGGWIPAKTGILGEAIARAYLRQQFGAVYHAGLLEDNKKNNYAVDLFADWTVYEVKAGLVNNGKSAWKWRSTVGQRSELQERALQRMSITQRAEFKARELRAVLTRKQQATQNLQRRLQHPIKNKMLASIINPQTRTADLFVFDGFHLHLRWNQHDLEKAHVGTFKF